MLRNAEPVKPNVGHEFPTNPIAYKIVAKKTA
jgi:hypothetical protein